VKVIRVIVFEADEKRMASQLARSLPDGVHGVTKDGQHFWNATVTIRTVAPDTEFFEELERYAAEQ
jgi:hypothetical protein